MEQQFFDIKRLQTGFNKTESVFVIGKFETLHLGHQQLLSQAKKAAKANNQKLIVMLYQTFANNYEPLFSNEQRIKIIKAFEPDLLVWFEPTVANYKISINAFFTYIQAAYGVKSLFVGENFTFNKGDDDLERMQELLPTTIVPLLKIKNQRISSALIRSFLQAGEIKEANAFLGFNYFYQGRVVSGNQRGRTMGFPTANVKVDHKPLVEHGIYYSYVNFEGKRYYAITSVYNNQTFGTDLPTTYESYLLHFDEVIYGKTLRVELLDLLRKPKRFATEESLIKAMQQDYQKALIYFKNKN